MGHFDIFNSDIVCYLREDQTLDLFFARQRYNDCATDT